MTGETRMSLAVAGKEDTGLADCTVHMHSVSKTGLHQNSNG